MPCCVTGLSATWMFVFKGPKPPREPGRWDAVPILIAAVPGSPRNPVGGLKAVPVQNKIMRAGKINWKDVNRTRRANHARLSKKSLTLQRPWTKLKIYFSSMYWGGDQRTGKPRIPVPGRSIESRFICCDLIHSWVILGIGELLVGEISKRMPKFVDYSMDTVTIFLWSKRRFGVELIWCEGGRAGLPNRRFVCEWFWSVFEEQGNLV
jgi:hypothetical protein